MSTKSTLFILLIAFVIGSQAGILVNDFYQQQLSYNSKGQSLLSASVDGTQSLPENRSLIAGASGLAGILFSEEPLSADAHSFIQALLYALIIAGLVVIAGELAERYYQTKQGVL